MKKFFIDFFFPFTLLVLVTAFIWLTGADMKASKFIYETLHGWVTVDRFPWSVLYTYAPFPGLVLAGGALFVFAAGFSDPGACPWTKFACQRDLKRQYGQGSVVIFG